MHTLARTPLTKQAMSTMNHFVRARRPGSRHEPARSIPTTTQTARITRINCAHHTRTLTWGMLMSSRPKHDVGAHIEVCVPQRQPCYGQPRARTHTRLYRASATCLLPSARAVARRPEAVSATHARSHHRRQANPGQQRGQSLLLRYHTPPDEQPPFAQLPPCHEAPPRVSASPRSPTSGSLSSYVAHTSSYRRQICESAKSTRKQGSRVVRGG